MSKSRLSSQFKSRIYNVSNFDFIKQSGFNLRDKSKPKLFLCYFIVFSTN